MPRFARYCLCVFVLRAGLALAQAPAKFEVASIKPSDPNAQGAKLIPAQDLVAQNLPLRDLISFAYNTAVFQLVGAPEWLTERYDISAKAPRGESAPAGSDQGTEQVRERVRSLLAERFGLRTHREMREQIVYLLIVAKTGPKLTEITEGDNHRLSGGRGRSEGWGATMTMLSTILSDRTGRRVIDKTGLTGRYDWKLEWAPDAEIGIPGQEAPPSTVGAGPTIFTALQEQLGLKLETAKGPVDTYVIDHIDRPSEN